MLPESPPQAAGEHWTEAYERGQGDNFKRHGLKHFLELECQLLHQNSHDILGKNCFLARSWAELGGTQGISPSHRPRSLGHEGE